MTRVRDGWRRFRRVIPPPDAPVRVDIEALPGAAVEARDISEAGMELRLMGAHSFRLDDMLTLNLWLPSEAVLRISARVRHIDLERMGVVFADMQPSGRQAIRRYMVRLAHRPTWRQRFRQLWQA
jgi:c-di-GMP-binding flagellar brake protein YcgR